MRMHLHAYSKGTAYANVWSMEYGLICLKDVNDSLELVLNVRV